MRCASAVVVVAGLLTASSALADRSPIAVSPGDTAKLARIGDTCPTFSWGEVEGARSYELVVYRLGEEGEEATPVLNQRISGSALSWTPSLGACLERGGRYAWSVRAVGKKAALEWSSPSLFEVASGPSEVEFEEAVRVVRSYLDASGGVRSSSGAAAERQAGPQQRSGTEMSVSSPAPTGVAATQLTVDGGVEATSFSGDGSGLTAVTAADLGCTACVAEGELDFDPTTQGELDTHAGSMDAHREHATLEESAEIDAEIVAHAGNSSVHHAPVTQEDITPTTTKGDLLVEDGADVVRLPVGTDGQVLVADSSQSEGVTWATVADSCPVCSAPALVPKTGQTTSYANRDDGELEKGVTWPNPRFTDNADGTVTDNLTGLIWLDDANCFGGQIWSDAVAKADALFDGCSDCGGTNNDCGLTDGSVAGEWRLPNVRELQSLAHYGVTSPAVPNTAGTGKWTADDPFSDVHLGFYWSSTTDAGNIADAWDVNMGNGFVGDVSKTIGYRVWPVRGGQ